jgi:aminoglycoside phosphotransferase (APT) family kinase protein
MSYVAGKSLGSIWHKAEDAQRERLIEQISNTLKVINEINPEVIGENVALSWQDSLVKNCQDRIKILLAKKIIADQKAQQILDFLNSSAYILANSPLKVVYWDIHFDNFIVNDDFELQAIIDLENVELTALDFPLFVIQKQTDEPWKYLAEDEEKYAKLEDYKKLKSWYKKYYPAMFEFNNLDMRLKLYQLADALHLLIDWSHNPETHQRVDELIGN